MSRKKSRVQGGWADQASSSSSPSSVSGARSAGHRQPGSGKVYTYKQPTEVKMSAGERPPNFSWVVEGVLAGSSLPQYLSHFYYYLNQGIKHIITLTDWRPPMHMAPAGLANMYLPIREFEAPSLEEIERFVDYVDECKDKNEAVVAHCYWGRGRTGTMLACYLIKYRNIDPWDAIQEVREQRPYSVETYEQEDAVVNYAENLKRKTEKPESPPKDNKCFSSEASSVENTTQ